MTGSTLGESQSGEKTVRATPLDEPRRPNIVLIVADDMGYSDIGCFGGEIPTPNIDGMAEDGVTMTQFYNGARCSPSRATLLSGLYAQQAGVGHLSEFGADDLPGYRGRLSEHCVTIAEVLRDAGYRTGMVGKWHVGGPIPWDDGSGYDVVDVLHPLDRGFDEYWGTLTGAGSYFAPATLMDGRESVDGPVSGDFYYTDEIGRRAAEMIDRMAADSRPFFAYVAHVAPHWPLHALSSDVDSLRISYEGGWQLARQQRFERLRSTGILDPGWDMAPADDGVLAWEDVSDHDWERSRMAVYAAQVVALDRAVGRVLASLERACIADDTVVMFMSDNGGCAEMLGPELPARFLGRRRGQGGLPTEVGNRRGLRPGDATTFMSYGHAWAHTSNTPFRLYKHWVHEGGVSTPFVARWPRGQGRGLTLHEPMHFIDVMATCVDLAGARYPLERNGTPIVPLEGQSFKEVLQGRSPDRVGAIFWEHEGNRAVRLGDLKLVAKHESPWELYRMDRDRTETVDLSQRYGSDVRRLESLWLDWARRCFVLPWNDVYPNLTPYFTF